MSVPGFRGRETAAPLKLSDYLLTSWTGASGFRGRETAAPLKPDAKHRGARIHLDGARIWNAHVATGVPLHRYGATADVAAVCLSKGLGAPVGSALCGSRELIARALRLRKMAGGGLRQAGLLAACALYALDHHVERLAEDHANARRLADGLRGIDGLTVRSAETNIVFVDVADGRGPTLLNHLKAHGVLATGLIGLRFVTHLGVGAAGIDRAVAATREFFAQATAGEAAAGPRGPY